MAEFALVALAELAARNPNAMATGPFGSSIGSKTFRAVGVPVIRGSNLSADVGKRLVEDDFVFIEPELAAQFARSQVVAGDLVFTCWGTINQVGLIDESAQYDRYVISNKQMKFTADTKKVLPLFLYYWFSSPEGQFYILGGAIGSSVPGFNLGQLRQMRVPLPSLRDQEAIASILGALDDKIDLNRRMNETLQAMARAIFQDWFVDFGPTRAKMEGRAPYLAPEIWSLFPNLLDNEGKPQGWKWGTLAQIARPQGQSVKPNQLSPDTPYIGLEHMPRRSLVLDTWEGAGKVTSGKFSFRQGDVLFGKLRPYFHKVGIAPLDGICSTDIVVLSAKARCDLAFIICCGSSDEFVAYTDLTSVGTKMPRTTWELMGRYRLCLPPVGLRQAFQSTAEPLFTKIVRSILETRDLAATRDLLLPKLMSGEIQAWDAANPIRNVA